MVYVFVLECDNLKLLLSDFKRGISYVVRIGYHVLICLQDKLVKEWDNQDRSCCSGNTFPNGMPLLRVNIAGNDSAYEGEDEDVPPRLSPNFAVVCFAEKCVI